jgi:hypothetical protein
VALNEYRSEFFTPDDLRILQVALDLAIRRDGMAPNAPEAEHVARLLIKAFQAGARDETSLLKAIGRWGKGDGSQSAAGEAEPPSPTPES